MTLSYFKCVRLDGSYFTNILIQMLRDKRAINGRSKIKSVNKVISNVAGCVVKLYSIHPNALKVINATYTATNNAMVNP